MSETTANGRSPGHCPRCGYDQRGLPSGSRCPECGEVFWGGRVSAEINRWADHTLLDLWSISVLVVVGAAALLVALSAFGPRHAGRAMLGVTGAIYLTAGVVWYAVSLIRFVRRRVRPVFLNMAPPRRRAISRWITMVGALIAGALLLVGVIL